MTTNRWANHNAIEFEHNEFGHRTWVVVPARDIDATIAEWQAQGYNLSDLDAVNPDYDPDA